MRSKGSNSAKNAGFTIIELMTVVVILGVLAALAAANFTTVLKRASLETSYRNTKLAFQRCRTEGLNADTGTSAAPLSAAMVLFTNGYACISWSDTDNNQVLGTGGVIDLGTRKTLAPGDANGEVIGVFFQYNYDDQFAINAAPGWPGGPEVFLAEAQSILQPVGFAQNAGTGYAFIVAAGGYYQAPNRTSMVGRVELQQPGEVNGLFKVNPNYHPARFCLFPSGQATEPIQVPGVC